MATQSASLMANVRPRIILNKCVRVKRSLISKGQLNVVKGTEVAPYNILGKYRQSSGFTSIHLSKALGLHPEEAIRALSKPLNSTIFKGELLATKKSWIFKKNVFAPTDGIIDSYNTQTGELRLKFITKEVPLTAGVFGIVEEVNQEKGEVLIKTMATLVYGVLGFGFERDGILELMGDSTSPINASRINSAQHQHILMGGAIVFKDALKRAASLGVRGIITGGYNLVDYRAMVGSLDVNQRLENDVGITVLATEGFGPIPMGEDIYKLLQSYDGKFVILDGNKKNIILPSGNQDSLIAMRKIVLPKNEELEPQILLRDIEIGKLARIIWPPLMGTQGKIVAIDKTPTMLESGISTFLVTIETSHRKIKVPFPNIELII